MNHYESRRRQDDGRWDYTCMNDGRIWPVGYCAPRIACECYGPTAAHGYGLQADPGCERCGGSGRVANPEHCGGGHDTPAQAEECFARYLLDGWREESYGDWTGCEWVELGERCDAPTKLGLTTRPPLGQSHALCDHHRTLEHLRHLAPGRAGQIIASW